MRQDERKSGGERERTSSQRKENNGRIFLFNVFNRNDDGNAAIRLWVWGGSILPADGRRCSGRKGVLSLPVLFGRRNVFFYGWQWTNLLLKFSVFVWYANANNCVGIIFCSFSLVYFLLRSIKEFSLKKYFVWWGGGGGNSNNNYYEIDAKNENGLWFLWLFHVLCSPFLRFFFLFFFWLWKKTGGLVYTAIVYALIVRFAFTFLNGLN